MTDSEIPKKVQNAWNRTWKLHAQLEAGLDTIWPVSSSIRLRDNQEDVGSAPTGRASPFGATGLDSLLLSGRTEHMVHWLAWSPEHGLLSSDVIWLPRAGEPELVAAKWRAVTELDACHPLMGVAEHSVWSPEGGVQYRARWGLPFPLSHADPLSRTCTATRASGLRGRLMHAALAKLPEGTDQCLTILRESSFLGIGLPAQCLMLHWVLGGEPTGHLDAMLAGERRRQFVQGHPYLALKAFKELAVTQAIDEGREPFPAVSQSLNLPQPLVRMLAHLPQDVVHAARLHDDDAREVMSLLRCMDPSWLPLVSAMDTAGWHVILALAEKLGETRRDGRPGPVTSIVARSLRPQGGNLEWVGRTGPFLDHLGDMARAMATELVLPALARTSPRAMLQPGHTRCVEHALMCMGLPRLARTLQAHLVQEVDRARMSAPASAEPGGGWGEAAPEVMAPCGLTLRFLVDQAQLDHESVAMDHCVGGYGERCEQRTSAVLSIGHWKLDRGERTWQPSSTVELGLQAAGEATRLQVVQHKGHGNRRPDGVDVEALEWWRGEESGGRIVLASGALIYSAEEITSAEDLPWRLGAQWNTPQAHAHRWEAWRRLLGVRSPSFGHWLMSLPEGFIESRQNERLATLAADMDQEMEIVAQVLALQDDPSGVHP